jgi:hypothetical protein
VRCFDASRAIEWCTGPSHDVLVADDSSIDNSIYQLHITVLACNSAEALCRNLQSSHRLTAVQRTNCINLSTKPCVITPSTAATCG